MFTQPFAQCLAHGFQWVVFLVIFLINMESLLLKRILITNYEYRKLMVNFYFEHQLPMTVEKLLKFLSFLLEKGEGQNHSLYVWK